MMKNVEKYTRSYFMPPEESTNWVKRESLQTAPSWCSVDLRDGNQALVVPMSLEQKLHFFSFLVQLGFKEIEVGFPAASETEFLFCRKLIEEGLIPPDVTIQVLTQARKHIIEKTFSALDGAQNAIVHLYNSTSLAQREQVFKKEKGEIIKIALDGAYMLADYAQKYAGNFRFEYSPESFTGTEMEFAVEICNSVLDVWKPGKEKKAIVNLPGTVELSMPHVYASQVEYVCNNIQNRENVFISLHPHNDRGCGVADAELGLLAGADRIEGTLFGNGERTGNVDIITLALNLYSHGVDPALDFSNLPEITQKYEEFTHMRVFERQPYSGALVFAAFSGSHQDAIAKGMKWREDNQLLKWEVPYLPIDPKDIGRAYDEDVIRINSQSGKGGIGYLLEQKFGYDLPKRMREDFGYTVKAYSDHTHREIQPTEVKQLFMKRYVNVSEPLQVKEVHFQHSEQFKAFLTVVYDNETMQLEAIGNGRLDSVCNALNQLFNQRFQIIEYKEHALEQRSASRACAYVGLESTENDTLCWGAGIHTDIIQASVYALVSAMNRALTGE